MIKSKQFVATSKRLPLIYDLALRYATARRRIEILSSFDTMLFSNGRIEARWSKASLNLCLLSESQYGCKLGQLDKLSIN